MRLMESLSAFAMALILVSSVVYADQASVAAEDETYKEVLLPNTTVVTGYPDQEDFYVVTKSEMPTLLAELNHRREMDELREVAKKHYALHDAIKLDSDIVLALNNRLDQLSFDHGKTLNDITFIASSKKAATTQGAELRFRHFPHTENITPDAEQLDSYAFAVRVASLFKQTRFGAEDLDSASLSKMAERPKAKKAKLKIIKTKKAALKKTGTGKEKVKKHRVVAQGKPSTFKTKRYHEIKRVTQVRRAPKFRIIEYSDIVATKKKPIAARKHSARTKISHELTASASKKQKTRAASQTRKRSIANKRAAKKHEKRKIANRKQARQPKFVVKELTFDTDNKLVMVDASKRKDRARSIARKHKFNSGKEVRRHHG